MRVDELMRYTQAFYPKWDAGYAEKLREQFGLKPTAQIKTLSKGQCAKAGLLAAQAHRPDLLLLDEPSSGLDPIVRRDILEAIIRTVADEGRTVFFSSHLLEEIERVRVEGIGQAELDRAKKQLHARLVFDGDSVTNIAHQIGYFETIANPDLFADLSERVGRVTLESVAEAAGRLLRPSNRTTGWFDPSNG
jgi:hypothetical protein